MPGYWLRGSLADLKALIPAPAAGLDQYARGHRRRRVAEYEWRPADQSSRATAPVRWNEIARARSENCRALPRSEEHTSELQSLMRNSYAVFCLKKKKKHKPLDDYKTDDKAKWNNITDEKKERNSNHENYNHKCASLTQHQEY